MQIHDCADCESIAAFVRNVVTTGRVALLSSGPAGDATITYSIGLLENFDHPELVITAVEPAHACAVLENITDAIALGEIADIDDWIDGFAPIGFALADVAERHLTDGTFHQWWDSYERSGICPPELRAVQIVFHESEFCGEHQGRQPLLDGSPADTWRPPGFNRAQRRAEVRRRRRRRR